MTEKKIVYDTHTLDLIPAAHRSHATSYQAPDAFYTESDRIHGILKSGKQVGDIAEIQVPNGLMSLLPKQFSLANLSKPKPKLLKAPDAVKN